MSLPASGRRIDWVSALMALVTSLALSWAAWLRFGPTPMPDPPAVGSKPPPLVLKDPISGEPLIVGRGGKVVWVAFWSAETRSGRDVLAQLDRTWNRLKARPRFVMIAAAVDADHPDRVRSARSESHATLPVYLAPPATSHAYGASDPPLHVLIDPEGRVAAVARGVDADTLARLSRQAEQFLDELEPLDDMRFAQARGMTDDQGRASNPARHPPHPSASLPRRHDPTLRTRMPRP